jgi:archaellum component FlaC
MSESYIFNAISSIIDPHVIRKQYQKSINNSTFSVMNNGNSNYRSMFANSKIDENIVRKLQEFTINTGHSNFSIIKKAIFTFFDVYELYEGIIVSIEMSYPYMIVKIFEKENAEISFTRDDNSMFYVISRDTRINNNPISRITQAETQCSEVKNELKKMRSDIINQQKILANKQKILEAKEISIANMEKNINEKSNETNMILTQKINELQSKIETIVRDKKINVAKSSKPSIKPRRSNRIKKVF